MAPTTPTNRPLQRSPTQPTEPLQNPGRFTPGSWLGTPVNTHLTGPEIAYIVSDAGCRAVLAHERFAGAVGDALAELGETELVRLAVGAVERCVPLDELLAGCDSSLPADRTMGGVMIYTSGTTGKPKGVRRPLPDADPDVMAGLTGMMLAGLGAGGDDGTYLACGPLYHSAPFVFTTGALHGGQTVVLTDRWDPEEALALIDTHRVTATHMVPTMFRRMLAIPAATRASYDVSSVRAVVHAAAPCPPEVKRAMLDWFGPGRARVLRLDRDRDRQHDHRGACSASWAAALRPAVQIRILDDDGTECQPARRATCTCSHAGSDRLPQRSRRDQSSTRDGFFTPATSATSTTTAFCTSATARPTSSSPAASTSTRPRSRPPSSNTPTSPTRAVIGVPDEAWGEQVLALAQPRGSLGEGQLADLEHELHAHCRQRIAGYKCPRSYEFRSELARHRRREAGPPGSARRRPAPVHRAHLRGRSMNLTARIGFNSRETGTGCLFSSAQTTTWPGGLMIRRSIPAWC